MITPVPGGVGPMTINTLIQQTVESGEKALGQSLASTACAAGPILQHHALSLEIVSNLVRALKISVRFRGDALRNKRIDLSAVGPPHCVCKPRLRVRIQYPQQSAAYRKFRLGQRDLFRIIGLVQGARRCMRAAPRGIHVVEQSQQHMLLSCSAPQAQHLRAGVAHHKRCQRASSTGQQLTRKVKRRAIVGREQRNAAPRQENAQATLSPCGHCPAIGHLLAIHVDERCGSNSAQNRRHTHSNSGHARSHGEEK